MTKEITRVGEQFATLLSREDLEALGSPPDDRLSVELPLTESDSRGRPKSTIEEPLAGATADIMHPATRWGPRAADGKRLK